MFIKYDDTNVHAIPHVKMVEKKLRNKKTGAVRTEMRMSPDLAPQEIKWLRPGWNEFPKDVWDQNKDHPGIKKMLASGKIELLAEKVTVTEGRKKITKVIGMDDEEVSIKLFSEARAIEIVKDTLNRDILQRWMDEENRSKVKRAIDKQIKPLLSTKSQEDDE